MTTPTAHVVVPGPAAPATPTFACTFPDGWAAREQPGALVCLAPDEASEVSVLISSSRVAKDVDLRDIAVTSLARQRKAHDQVTIDSQRVGRFGERVVYVRGVTVVTVVDGSATAQVQALFFGPAGDERTTADVFSLVGSCPSAEIGDYGPLFVDILASVSFDEEGSAR